MRALLILSIVLLSACAGKRGLQGAAGLNGQPGEPGQDAEPNPYGIVEIIKPCDGHIVLMRFSSGVIIGEYSHGNRQYLMEYVPGTYVPYDGSHCTFTVNEDLSVVW